MGTDLTHPFEADAAFLREHIDAFVEATIADLASEFLLLPRGPNFIEYEDFREAFEVLKRHTQNFNRLSYSEVFAAAVENSRVVGVVRAMLGMSPGEWADLALSFQRMLVSDLLALSIGIAEPMQGSSALL
jgi:hypothetical protein